VFVIHREHGFGFVEDWKNGELKIRFLLGTKKTKLWVLPETDPMLKYFDLARLPLYGAGLPLVWRRFVDKHTAVYQPSTFVGLHQHRS
jgi:hypothetical protein